MDPREKKKIVIVDVIVIIAAIAIIAAAVVVRHFRAGQAVPSVASSTPAGQSASEQALIAERPQVCQKFSNLADAEKDPGAVCFLDLSNQKLTSFPTEVLQFENMEYLDLADNDLTSVPPEISQLTKLTDLWLNGNQLTVLPSAVGSMNDLVLLSLFQNQLSSLPSLTGLKYLAILGISGNPISSTQRAALKVMLPKTSII
jgi:hypothetical protein